MVDVIQYKSLEYALSRLLKKQAFVISLLLLCFENANRNYSILVFSGSYNTEHT
jgi:hypothetical protein